MSEGAGRQRRRRVVRRDANAKINVFLRVLGARGDGYHELESLVVPISLADVVTVRPADELRVDVSDAGALADDVPTGGLNLALVAALALADACGVTSGALIRIDKRIPVAAGLGGGSSDAAATLRALNELWACDVDEATLAEVAARIGSDVPAMLSQRPMLMSGRGERLAPAEVRPRDWVLVWADVGVRSPDAYRWWDEAGGATGPDPTTVLEAAAGGDAATLAGLLFNDLEAPVVARRPEIAEMKRRLLEAGALGAVMSGSGSAVAGLARDADHARELASGFERATAVSGPPAVG